MRDLNPHLCAIAHCSTIELIGFTIIIAISRNSSKYRKFLILNCNQQFHTPLCFKKEKPNCRVHHIHQILFTVFVTAISLFDHRLLLALLELYITTKNWVDELLCFFSRHVSSECSILSLESNDWFLLLHNNF